MAEELRVGAVPDGIERVFGMNVFDVENVNVPDLIDLVCGALSRDHCAYIRHFPLTPREYVGFLSNFGSLLPSYSAEAWPEVGEDGKLLNRVRCLPTSVKEASTHERGGALPAHTARSWRDPTPGMFAILMVNPGWQGKPKGWNGESMIVPWRVVLRALAKIDETTGTSHLHILAQTAIRFGANRVREPELDAPIVFRLDDSRDPFDYGVRLRSGLVEVLDGMRQQGLNVEQLRDASKALIDVTQMVATEYTYQMHVGDLAIVDNRRYGHGRQQVVGERTGRDGTTEANPRELWSATLDAKD